MKISDYYYLANKYYPKKIAWDDSYDYEDVLQDCRVGLIEAKHRYKNENIPFEIFAQKRIKGAAIDSVRKMIFGKRSREKLRKYNFDFLIEGVRCMIAKHENDTEILKYNIINELSKNKEERLKFDIKEVLSKLNPDEREILRLKYFYNYKNFEIALKFGISEARVSQRLKAVYRKIKKIWEGK